MTVANDFPSEETYYTKMEPRAAWILVCDDIAAALGELPNGVNGA